MPLNFKTLITTPSSSLTSTSRLSSSIIFNKPSIKPLKTPISLSTVVIKPPKMSSSSSSSWTCSKCTFINPPWQKSNCQICLTTTQQAQLSSSSSSKPKWSCSACTFLNPYRSTACEICGTRASASVISTLEIDEHDEMMMGSSIGSVFLPLKGCGGGVAKGKSENPLVVDGGDQECVSRGKNDIDGGLRACSNNGKRKVRDESIGDGVDDFGDSPMVMAIEDDDVELVGVKSLAGKSVSDSESKGCKIMSYNIWFREDLEMHNRMKALGNLIRMHSPDVICFQEVTPNFYNIFKQASWWKSYKCSIPNEKAFPGAYFCMQLSKLPVKSYGSRPFHNTIMGRQLHIAEVMTTQLNIPLTVATSHLESPCPSPPTWDQMFSKERVAQAKESVNFLEKYQNVIFCGDMNWDDKLDGPFPLSDKWLDAWARLKPGDVGFTYDTKSNKMLSGNRSLQKRLDRFLCKLKDFKISEIEMIGVDAIPGLTYVKEKKVKGQVTELELPVLPSDHYGLVLTITPE